MPDDEVEEEISLEPGAFEIKTDGESVSADRIFSDGGDGLEKEVVVLDPVAGASSDAPATSGIPSAVRQQSIHEGTNSGHVDSTPGTTMADKTIPMRQDVKP